jgi:hypothetical protein
MRPEVHIAAGRSVEEALTAFRQCVNQPGTMFSTDHWLLPKLDQLKRLLTDPNTQDEAEALLEVLHQRHWMRDLLEWLERRPIGWGNYFTHKANLAQEEIRKRADERDRRRGAGLDPWGVVKLFADGTHPKISDMCPDCSSSDWKPIAYGLPTEDTLEDIRRGHYVLGGCAVREPKRYCFACFNRWPTKPNVSRPAGKPEWVERRIVETRSKYAKLCALAELPPDPEEPRVERAWARIDGSVEFLLAFGEKKARNRKTLEYARLGGAPVYEMLASWSPFDDYEKRWSLAAVAALRFEQTGEPERHNLYNNWDIVQAHRKKFYRGSEKRASQWGWERSCVKKNRETLS